MTRPAALADAAPATRETVLTNARLVLPGEVVRGSVAIRDGRIADISEGPVATGEDCGGDFVAPGLIELHTDNLERHLEPRPGARWPLEAAVIAHDAELASVGVTTVFDAVRIGSVESFRKANYGRYGRGAVDAILGLKRAGALRVSHLIHLRAEICSETLEEELAQFSEEDEIRILSLMDHTPGYRQFRDVNQLRRYHEGKYGRHELDFDEYLAFMAEL
ncbi:MAG: alpha-D-ribose 1-methylphosphonate 5-triphosphate diphosphatase, partial [Pseudomonadota bacterium]